jgi:hypothetical protein
VNAPPSRRDGSGAAPTVRIAALTMTKRQRLPGWGSGHRIQALRQPRGGGPGRLPAVPQRARLRWRDRRGRAGPRDRGAAEGRNAGRSALRPLPQPRLLEAVHLLPGDLAGDLATSVAWPTARPVGAARSPSLPWLFPGHRSGSALTEDALAQRLHAIGVSPPQGRGTALLTLAAEVPAAIVAKILGINVQAAIQWQSSAPVTGPPTPPTSAAARRTPAAPPVRPDRVLGAPAAREVGSRHPPGRRRLLPAGR